MTPRGEDMGRLSCRAAGSCGIAAFVRSVFSWEKPRSFSAAGLAFVLGLVHAALPNCELFQTIMQRYKEK